MNRNASINRARVARQAINLLAALAFAPFVAAGLFSASSPDLSGNSPDRTVGNFYDDKKRAPVVL
jgi:hypothetical protein